MVESRNNGVPLCIQAPRSKLTRSIEELVASISGGASDDAPPEETGKKKKRLFSFLGAGS